MGLVADRHEPYVEACARLAAERAALSPEWLRERRAHASAAFASGGFPTTRLEDWRFTNVAPIAEEAFAPARGVPRAAALLVDREALPGSVRLALVNGAFVPELSDLRHLPRGVRIAGLRDGVRDGNDLIEQHLATTLAIEGHPFAALNTALLDDGVAVMTAPGAAVETLIHVVVVTAADPQARESSGPPISHPRVLVVAGAASRLRLAQTFVGDEDAAYFMNAVTEVVVGEGARVDLVTDQRESRRAFHVAALQARVEARGEFASHVCALGARLMRHDIGATLAGEGGTCTMNGVYLADGDRLMDTHTSLDHAAAHCTSHELYKGILAGRARGVFNGRILVRQDAQKTDAKQTNRALLLSDEAQVNSNPQLEIFADDVKCTHGAAIGQLDDEALFYLQARGLTPAAARDMLLHAFAGEVLGGVAAPDLRARMESALFAALERDLAGA